MNIDPQFPGLMTGPLAEQFVGQELLATYDPLLEEKLFGILFKLILENMQKKLNIGI